MPNPFRDFFLGTLSGTAAPKKELADALIPRRSFADVILPASTHKQLEFALLQIKKADLIFGAWGLGERHSTGLGLAFNFAGPPGTGKTICAEAIAHELGKSLLIVRYAEMESLWAGETSKNVSAIFRTARELEAVLFFDEADAIATRRFGSVTQGYQRESNAVVNVLLKELEEFDGVVIFATNIASNFDPAFERRIRTHILFEMPDAPAREKVWKVQLHSRKTPIAEDVNFKELAERYVVSGGDIKNAVLKAAQMASAEPGPDAEKKIHQRHFVAGIEDVMTSRKVMEQSIIDPNTLGDGSGRPSVDASMMAGMSAAFEQLAQNDRAIGEDLSGVIQKADALEAQLAALPDFLNRVLSEQTTAREGLRTELSAHLEKLGAEVGARFTDLKTELARENERAAAAASQLKVALVLGGAGLVVGAGALIATLVQAVK